MPRITKRDMLIENLRRFNRTKGLKYLSDANITSVGTGYKITNGKRTPEVCVQFTVRSKMGEDDVQLEDVATNVIPKSLKVAGEKEEIPTDVIERDYGPSYHLRESEETNPRKLRVDPIMPGISVSHPGGSAGTLGLIVYDRTTGRPCMLSNWHVLHGSSGSIGDEVVQPGPADDNHVGSNQAGTLLRSHLGHAGDCAVAQIEDREIERTILDLKTFPTQIARVELDDVVIKSGRTTGVTKGVVRRVDVIANINYGSGVGVQEIGAFEVGVGKKAPDDFEISMGGDSGSSWLAATKRGKATDVLVGLHFAGESKYSDDEHALACYAHSVFKKLDIRLEPPTEAEALAAAGGYDQNFLTETIPIPWLSHDDWADAYKHDNYHMIPYTHFSVCLSRERRLARFVAWNIDGSRIKVVSDSSAGFRLDPKIDREYQSGNELYKSNKLDRGHIARRADLAWGSVPEARRSNKESFFYTNIAPQHEEYNRSKMGGIWGELENALMRGVKIEKLRVSVMAGPVFADGDPVHRGVPIPREYWKLLAYRDADDGVFKVSAFILTQKDLLHELEVLDLDPFRLFQVSLGKLKEKTNLDFSKVENFDTFGGESEMEALGVTDSREITSGRNIFK